MSKRVLRESIRRLNAERNTTIILTTHDMDDIEAVCSRLILIDKGKTLFDGTLASFKAKYEEDFTVKLLFKQEPAWEEDKRFALSFSQDGVWTVHVSNLSTKDALMILLERYNLQNIYVEEPQIEELVANIFS